MLKVFSVYDSKIEAFMQPFFLRTRGEAIRAFTELCSDATSNPGKYPADFTLFELGTFEELSGKFVMHTTPTSLGLALDFKRVDHVRDIPIPEGVM